MTLYAETWPFLCENPYGGVVYYEVYGAAEDEERVCLVVQMDLDFDFASVHRHFPILLTHKEIASWSYVRATIQEEVDEKIHESYRVLTGSSMVAEPEHGDDD